MANRNDPFYLRLQERFIPANQICVENLSRKSSGIYCIHNTINDRFYIGSAATLVGRKDVHLSNLKHNKHHSQFLQNDYNKHSKDDFDFYVIETVEDKHMLLTREQEYLDSIIDKSNCYNCCYTASSWLGNKHTEETKAKIRAKRLGTHHSEETKQKIKDRSAKARGKYKHTEESRAKLSKAHMGKHLSEETKQKMSKTRTGVPLSATHPIRGGHKEETKKKISQAMLGDKNHFFGKHHSAETRQLIKEQRTGIENYFGPVCSVIATNIATGEIRTYPSMAQAGRELDIRGSHVSRVCSGELTQTGGWKFKKEIV